MLIMHVHIHVKAENVDAFKAATLANATASAREPGVLRFDFEQQIDDPQRFVLVEIYRDAADHAAHRESTHYKVWREAVASMMAEPRTAVKYERIFPKLET